MEYRLELKKDSSDHPSFNAFEKTVLTQESRRSNSKDKLRVDKRGLTYSDFHCEIMKNVEDVHPKNLENRLKPRVGRTASGERDLVKYRSYVPSYIKKGEGKDVRKNTSTWSPSSSSSLWTDQCVSPSHQRMNHPPLQFYLMSSKPGDCPKASGETGGTFHSHHVGRSVEKDGRFIRSPSGAKFQQQDKKEVKLTTVSTTGTFSNISKPNVPPSTRVISKTQAGDLRKKGEKLDDRNRMPRVHDVPGKEKASAVFVPGIVPQKQFIGLSKLYDTKVFLAERVAETDRKAYIHGDSDTSDGNKSFLKRIGFLSLEKNSFSSERSRSVPRSAKVESSPSRGRALIRSPSKQSDQRSAKVLSERARSISPFRRLSFSIGKSNKGSNSKDDQTPPRLSTPTVSSRPSSDDSSCSSIDKPSSSSRGRSSPLRRLLEPLMKPKASNSCKTPEPSQRGACSSHQKHVSSDTQLSSSVPLSRTGKLSTVQALFRVTSKNDQPLFTFAVEKEQNITAATVRKQNNTSEMDGSGYSYTFFTVQEVRKKSGKWMNHGGKGQGQNQEYTSNIVAQMRVSSGPEPSTSVDRLVTREFVLVGSESHQRTNELAAIVIKVPKAVDRSWTDINTTLILPSGIHSLPHKGGPSSLIQRWRSGGGCDCGGWDMGCNLRIFTSQHQPSCSSDPTSNSSPGFKLFFQGGLEDNQTFMSFTPYKDGIYAVEYSSSLSLLQAFSVCIAVNDSRNTMGASETNPPLQGQTSRETISIPNERLKSFSGLVEVEGEVPARPGKTQNQRANESI